MSAVVTSARRGTPRAALTLALAMTLAACGTTLDAAAGQGAGEVVQLEIAGDRVPCEGEGPMQCLQIRRDPGGTWELFYDEIDGYEPTPGMVEVALVRIVPVDDPPADGSSLDHSLVEILDRRPAD